jgi:hypothetical protein
MIGVVAPSPSDADLSQPDSLQVPTAGFMTKARLD